MLFYQYLVISFDFECKGFRLVSELYYCFYLLQSEQILLSDKYKIEKEENTQLRNQVTQLLQLEQDQKLQIQQQDSTIQSLQVGPILC